MRRIVLVMRRIVVVRFFVVVRFVVVARFVVVVNHFPRREAVWRQAVDVVTLRRRVWRPRVRQEGILARQVVVVSARHARGRRIGAGERLEHALVDVVGRLVRRRTLPSLLWIADATSRLGCITAVITVAPVTVAPATGALNHGAGYTIGGGGL
jgi:hypothetical protein